MHRFALLAGALIVMSMPAAAQTLYRCGSTYSQTPCSADAAPAKVLAGAAPDAVAGDAGRDLCALEGVNRLAFPDPDSTRIRSITKTGTEVIQYAGKPMAARHYAMVINAKNVQGVYTGDRRYSCYLSEDERRVLQVNAR